MEALTEDQEIKRLKARLKELRIKRKANPIEIVWVKLYDTVRRGILIEKSKSKTKVQLDTGGRTYSTVSYINNLIFKTEVEALASLIKDTEFRKEGAERQIILCNDTIEDLKKRFFEKMKELK